MGKFTKVDNLLTALGGNEVGEGASGKVDTTPSPPSIRTAPWFPRKKNYRKKAEKNARSFLIHTHDVSHQARGYREGILEKRPRQNTTVPCILVAIMKRVRRGIRERRHGQLGVVQRSGPGLMNC